MARINATLVLALDNRVAGNEHAILKNLQLRHMVLNFKCPTTRRNPNKATTRVSISRPDRYERPPRSCEKSFANGSRYIHMGRSSKMAQSHSFADAVAVKC